MASEERVDSKLPVTHLNIRESISILVLKLVVIDAIATFFIGISYAALSMGVFSDLPIFNYPIIILVIIVILAIAKISVTVYVVLEWMNEYYEMYPEYIIHRRGVFFKKERRQNMKGITEIMVYQPTVGRLFNFGTIVLYNYRRMELMTLYLIHNPMRYEKILNSLIVGLTEEQETTRGRVLNLNED